LSRRSSSALLDLGVAREAPFEWRWCSSNPFEVYPHAIDTRLRLCVCRQVWKDCHFYDLQEAKCSLHTEVRNARVCSRGRGSAAHIEYVYTYAYARLRVRQATVTFKDFALTFESDKALDAVLVISKMVLRITVDFPMEKKPNMTLSQQYSELYVVDDSLSLSLSLCHSILKVYSLTQSSCCLNV